MPEWKITFEDGHSRVTTLPTMVYFAWNDSDVESIEQEGSWECQ